MTDAGFATSSDGTRIAFTRHGDETRPPILLIHGWAQQSVCWQPVTERLSDRFFVVAMDLRGHGASDKPSHDAAYTDTRLWGDDVKAVMDATGLQRPVLTGWSYASRVIAAHVATYGDAHLSGIVLAGGILAIGRMREDWMVGPASPGLDRDLYTDDIPRRLAATVRFVDACTARPLDRRTFAELVGANMLCPAHVRRALFGADVDLRPVYASLGCPGLVIHGTADAVVSPETGRTTANLLPRGLHRPYDGVGHAPFLEEADRFAADVAEFLSACR
ncbi:alpha/beta fold hydrolase [Roseibacterium sp. SDUM158017]|uniref:alpha/beta fold hydrolase n=1 Tax=Roseicyclus salinarum TaxID=3036773 RepID=UPI00241522E4|nr:alpha/beta fold hydrolase [Roseibacterium sp. SDUM158017]MDG4649287.1 alpha/beta fold hydrolase [Roseibacterium sp. SDUM158017]